MPVSMKEPEAMGPVSVFVSPRKSEDLRITMTWRRLNDLMILHVHKERVDRLGLDKIAENYVSGRKDTLRMLG